MLHLLFCFTDLHLHWGLSKYLTAQDTYFSPTPTKQSRDLSIHGNLSFLQSNSTVEAYTALSVPSIEFIQQLNIALSWYNKIYIFFPFLKPNWIHQAIDIYTIHFWIFRWFHHYLLSEISVYLSPFIYETFITCSLGFQEGWTNYKKIL